MKEYNLQSQSGLTLSIRRKGGSCWGDEYREKALISIGGFGNYDL